MSMMNQLEIMPEQYYLDTLKPCMDKIYMKCKYDEELLRSIEKATNAANQHAIRKEYAELQEDFLVLYKVLTNAGYINGKVWSKASQSEKDMVQEFVKLMEDFFLILKVTSPEPKQETAQKRERIGYDPNTHQNGNSQYEFTCRQERRRL